MILFKKYLVVEEIDLEEISIFQEVTNNFLQVLAFQKFLKKLLRFRTSKDFFKFFPIKLTFS